MLIDLQAIEAEIKKYQKRKEKVYEDYLDGKIPEDLYTRKFEEFGVKLRLKQEQRESLELANDDYYTTVSYLLKLAHNAENLFEKANQEQKRTILNIIVSNLELDGHLLRWKYKKPFEMMALCTEMNSWLRLLGRYALPLVIKMSKLIFLNCAPPNRDYARLCRAIAGLRRDSRE